MVGGSPGKTLHFRCRILHLLWFAASTEQRLAAVQGGSLYSQGLRFKLTSSNCQSHGA